MKLPRFVMVLAIGIGRRDVGLLAMGASLRCADAGGNGQLASSQPGSRRLALLAARPDQPDKRDVARAALALPARRHRRRQQSDHADHRRRHDVRDRFARQRVRGRTRPTAICCGSYDVTSLTRRRRARRLRLPQPRCRRTPTASSTPPAGRSSSRSTRRPASRFRRSATTARPASSSTC